MNAAILDRQIYRGRAQAARHVGQACTVYRPVTDAPLGNWIAELKAAFSTDTTYKKPNLFGKPVWYGDFDGTQTKPGDYLVRVRDRATWFIATQPSLLAIELIDCQRTLTIARQAALTGVGAVGYSGVIDPTMVLGVNGAWPASILLEGGAGAAAGLPGDATEASWKILLPVSLTLTVESTDIVTDDLGRRFEVLAAELTELGWRLSAKEVHA